MAGVTPWGEMDAWVGPGDYLGDGWAGPRRQLAGGNGRLGRLRRGRPPEKMMPPAG